MARSTPDLRLVAAALSIAATGAPAMARELAAVDTGLRAPVSTSRRIAVVAAHGGAGATTAVARAGIELSRRRWGAVLVVDAARGSASLAARVGVTAPLSLARDRERGSGVTHTAQARALFPRGTAGLAVLGAGAVLSAGAVLGAGAVPSADAARQASPAQWRAAVDPVGRFFDVILTDWGARADGGQLGQIASAHHGVVVVSRADRGCAERAAALVARLAAVPVGPRIALLLVDVGGTGGPTAGLLRRELASSHLHAAVLAVPHEHRLAAAGSAELGHRLGHATRLAYARLAVELLTLRRDRPGTDARGTAPRAAASRSTNPRRADA